MHDGVEEVPDPPGEVSALLGGYRHYVSGRVLEPECGREARRPGYRLHLLVAGVLYAALPEVGEVGAGHNVSRGLVELLARPPASVRATVGIEEKLEPLSYVQEMFLKLYIFVSFKIPNHMMFRTYDGAACAGWKTSIREFASVGTEKVDQSALGREHKLWQ
jgi:hypothetical protein